MPLLKHYNFSKNQSTTNRFIRTRQVLEFENMKMNMDQIKVTENWRKLKEALKKLGNKELKKVDCFQ